MSKLVSNSPFSGRNGKTKQVESLTQNPKSKKKESLGQTCNVKRKGTEPLYWTGKGDKNDREKTSKKRKRGKIELGCQVKNQIKKPRKVKSVEREDITVLYQKNLRPAVVSYAP